MPFHKIIPITLATALAVILSACSGLNGSGVRVTEGNQPQSEASAPSSVMANSSAATLVHVDMFERIATIRNGRKLPNGFFAATDNSGTQTALLKAQPKRPIGLRTADILEGKPGINDTVSPVSAAESARLAQLYPDPIIIIE